MRVTDEDLELAQDLVATGAFAWSHAEQMVLRDGVAACRDLLANLEREARKALGESYREPPPPVEAFELDMMSQAELAEALHTRRFRPAAARLLSRRMDRPWRRPRIAEAT